MKNLRKSSLLLLVSAFVLVGCGRNGGEEDYGDAKIIYVDGGGDISSFNTTASMTKSIANPYPYNTLEKLLDEWSNAHPGYRAKLNKTSSMGDRSILLPQLQTHTAPHIIYQNGTVISTDLGQDYYVPLKDYLDAPSPYLPGNAAWKTVYNQSELATTQASDGEFYYVNMEKIPVAFVYNKTILTAAGINNPENEIKSFKQLIEALAKVDTLYKGSSDYNGYGKYATEYTWYQIAMESGLFADMVEKGDVIRHNGNVDTEEMCRLFSQGTYDPLNGITSKTDALSNDYSENRLYDYIKCIEALDTYKENSTFAARQQWIAGRLAFMEVTGNLLRTLNAVNSNFEWGTICFPDITKETSQYGGKGCVRGTAGLATSYWISNRALDDGTADMCADLLMFLTAPEQNNRMVGDLKGGIPLNPSSGYELAPYLQPLVAQYDEDIAAVGRGERVCWAAFNTWGNLGTSYQTTFIQSMQELDAHLVDPSTGITAEEATTKLAYSMKNTFQAYIIEYDYDTANWPAAK